MTSSFAPAVHLVNSEKQKRNRKFNPKLLFLTIIYLTGNTNHQGYQIALKSVWANFGEMLLMPAKSSLSKVRKSVSYQFFKEIFYDLVKNFEPYRKTFCGFYIYAIDGDRLELPPSRDLLNKGYRGVPCKNKTETYLLRMYFSHAYDVVSGVTKSIRHSTWNNEIRHAVDMVSGFEENSITLYDRLYLCKKVINAHKKHNNFFIARCKKGSTFTPIKNLFNCNKWSSKFVIEGVNIYFYKIKNSKTGQVYVFATNLPHGTFSKKEIGFLYTSRWEIETAFRDSTSTMKLEQWHSKSLNGILQELYAHYWLLSYTRIQIFINEGRKSKDMFTKEYRRPNFKLIFEFILEKLPQIMKRLSMKFMEEIKFLIKTSMEKRKRFSRHYKRQVKFAKNRFNHNSLVKRREA